MSVLETAENKRDKKLSRKIRGFDLKKFFFLPVKQVFAAAVAGSIREAQLTSGVQMTKTREGRRTLKSHIGQPLQKFVM